MPANNFLDKYKNNIEATLINAAKMRPGQLQSKKIDTYSKNFLTLPIKKDIESFNHKDPYVSKENQQANNPKNNSSEKEIKSKSSNDYTNNNANFDIDEIERLNPSGQAQPQLAVKSPTKFTFHNKLNKDTQHSNPITPSSETLKNKEQQHLEPLIVDHHNEKQANIKLLNTTPDNTHYSTNNSNTIDELQVESQQSVVSDVDDLKIPDTPVVDNSNKISFNAEPPVTDNHDEISFDVETLVTDNHDEVSFNAEPLVTDNPNKISFNTEPPVADNHDKVSFDVEPLVADNPNEVSFDVETPVADNHDKVSFDVEPLVIDSPNEVNFDVAPLVAKSENTIENNQPFLNENNTDTSQNSSDYDANDSDKTYSTLPIIGNKQNLINKQPLKNSFKRLIISEITTVKTGKVVVQAKQSNSKNLSPKSDEKKEYYEKPKHFIERKTNSMKSSRKTSEVKNKSFFSEQTDRVKKAINNLTTIVKEMIDDEFNQKNKNKKMARKYIPQWSDEKLENPKFVIKNKTTLYAQIETESQKKLNEIIIKQKKLEQFKTLCNWNAGSISLLIEAYLLENFKDKQKVSITPNHLKKIGLSQDDDTNTFPEEIDEYSQKEIDDAKDYTFFNPIAARISENKAQRERKEREEKITNYRKALNIYSDEEGSVYQKAIADFLRENKDFLDEVKRDDAYLNELEELEED